MVVPDARVWLFRVDVANPLGLSVAEIEASKALIFDDEGCDVVGCALDEEVKALAWEDTLLVLESEVLERDDVEARKFL